MFVWQRNKNRNLQGKPWWLIQKTLLLYSSKWAIICCFFIYFLANINAKSYICKTKRRVPLTCTTNMLFERLHQWYQYLFLQLFSINSGVHLISFDLKWRCKTNNVDSAVYKIWNSIQGSLAFFYHEILLVDDRRTASHLCRLQGNDCYYIFL